MTQKTKNPLTVIHCGDGSDLTSLCGTMLGTSGQNQVRLSYIDEQVTCVGCLLIKVNKLLERMMEVLNEGKQE